MARFWRQPVGTGEFWARLEHADTLEDDGRYAELLALTDQLLLDGYGSMPAFGEHMARVHRYRLVALGGLGRGPEAWAHFGTVLSQFLATPQPGDSVRVLRCAMGDILLRLGHDDHAQEQFALAVAESRACASPADTVELDALIAASEVNAGRHAEAERRLRALATRLAIVQIAEAERVRIRGLTLWMLAVALNGQGRFREAEATSAKASAAYVAHEGPGGDLGRNARLARARALVELGRAYEAEAECLLMFDEFDVADRLYAGQLCVLRTVLGRAFTVQRRHDQAVADLEAAVAHGCEAEGAGDPVTLDAVLALAAAHHARGGTEDATAAQRLLETAVREGEAGPDAGHPLVAAARERLTELTTRMELEVAARDGVPVRPWRSRVQPGLKPCWNCGDHIWSHEH